MAMSLDELIAAILRLPREDLTRLYRALNSAHAAAANAVRDGAATYQSEHYGEPMTIVTLALPEELAEQARNAGLLAGESLEEIIRRAVQENDAAIAGGIAPRQERRLVRENGYLVVEALPGEKPITTEEVKKILDDMEW